jgi:hypothetical protein
MYALFFSYLAHLQSFNRALALSLPTSASRPAPTPLFPPASATRTGDALRERTLRTTRMAAEEEDSTANLRSPVEEEVDQVWSDSRRRTAPAKEDG